VFFELLQHIIPVQLLRPWSSLQNRWQDELRDCKLQSPLPWTPAVR
jgi:hypothetical protein